MYQEFHPKGRPSDEVIEKILSTLIQRLKDAYGDRFLPKLIFTRIGFEPYSKVDTVSIWGQPLLLLRDIAEFPRKVITDPYFTRGLRIDQNELLHRMDVCDDAILTSRDANKAREELSWIKEIVQVNATTQSKCSALLTLIRGAYLVTVRSKLVQEKAGSTNQTVQ